MAIITCPECSGKVSDKAAACPHCGAPLTPNLPPPIPGITPSQPQQSTNSGTPAAPQVGLQTARLQCPNCGSPLQAKDILSSGWAHCPSCHKDVQLTGANNAFADGIVEKIMPFGASKDYFHRTCMQTLMDKGVEDVFEKIQDLRIEQKYVWVREFGYGSEREIYPMNEYGKNFFKDINGSTIMKSEIYEDWWPTDSMVEFNSSVASGKQLLPKEMSSKECKYQYSKDPECSGYAETQNYYCLPIYEESYTYEGKRYVFRGVGDNIISKYCWDDMPSDTDVVCGKPKFTEMTPCVTTAIILAVIALVIIEIAFFSNGFWAGVGYTILLAIVLSIIGAVAGAIILVPLVAIDTIIQKSVNTSRRKKFRARYEQIQRKKQQDAKRMLNLDLTYTVPEFPIP